MAEISNECEINLSDNEDQFVKSFINEIIDILELDDKELGNEIARNLMENGRDGLRKYEDEIICRVYNQMMNNQDSKLINSLKEYFRQKWEIQYGSTNPWFISFLKQYENEEKHEIYERILTRTAQYGNKYMKDFPLLSIVLQLLFTDIISEECLQETNVFDDLWMSITNDGLQSISKYSDYIVKKDLDEQLEKESVLFKALRKYYRPNVSSALKQSGSFIQGSFYDLLSDDITEFGWLSEMERIKEEFVPKRFQIFKEELRSFHNKEKNVRKGIEKQL